MRLGTHLGSLTLASIGLCLITGCSGGPPLAGPAHTGPSSGNPLAGNPLAGNPLAGDSSSGPPDASLAGVHACKLVPATVVARVIGPLLERPYESPQGRDCFYQTAVPGGGGPTYILSVITRSGYETSKTFAEGVSQSGAARLTNAPGLGDDAFALTTAKGQAYTLWAVRGGAGLSVQVNDKTSPGVRKAHDLLAAALGGL
jgi:hypothetical protein